MHTFHASLDLPVRNFLSQSPAATALLRGLLGRCPCCGHGRMFRAFLKVSDRCEVCGEELHHHRADDFPAYIVIFIVGHTLMPIVLYVETNFAPSYWIEAAIWLPAVLISTIGLLQPTKGVIVALQWHMGMHGFEQSKAHGACGAHAADRDLAPSPALVAATLDRRR